MKTLNLKQMEMIEGGRFWGTQITGPIFEIDTSCSSGVRETIYEDTYVCWIRTNREVWSSRCVTSGSVVNEE